MTHGKQIHEIHIWGAMLEMRQNKIGVIFIIVCPVLKKGES
jgi:hypothetical protein